VDAHKKTPVQTRTRPKQLATRQSRTSPRSQASNSFSGGLGMLFVILYEIANNQIGVDQPFACSPDVVPTTGSFSRSLADLCEGHPLTFLLASAPFSDRVPGCTRMVAWSPSTKYSSLSPA